MINLILFLAVTAVILYMAVIYGSLGLALVAFTGIVMAAAAYIYLFLQLFGLQFLLAIPISVAGLREEVDIQFSVKNKGVLPAAKLTCCLRYENLLTGERGNVKCRTVADAKKTSLLSLPVRAEHCGKYRVWLHRVRIYDLTGMFCLGIFCRKYTEFCVLPQIYDTAAIVSEPSRHFMGEADVYDDKAGGTDASEVFDIREFRDGDKIQSIHWKMSAKADELMVRENSQPLGCPVVLLLDFSGKGTDADAFLTLAASISFALIDQKCAHYVAWHSGREGDVLRVRVDDEESFYRFLMLLYEERKKTAIVDVCGRYKEKYRAEPFVTEIFVKRNLTVTVGEREQRTFSSAKLEQELGGVEFIV